MGIKTEEVTIKKVSVYCDHCGREAQLDEADLSASMSSNDIAAMFIKETSWSVARIHKTFGRAPSYDFVFVCYGCSEKTASCICSKDSQELSISPSGISVRIKD